MHKKRSIAVCFLLASLFFLTCPSPLAVSLAASAQQPPTPPFACAGANPGQCDKSFLRFLHCIRDQKLAPEHPPDLRHSPWLRGEEFITPCYGQCSLAVTACRNTNKGRMKLAGEIPLWAFSNSQTPASAPLVQPW